MEGECCDDTHILYVEERLGSRGCWSTLSTALSYLCALSLFHPSSSACILRIPSEVPEHIGIIHIIR